MGYKHIIIASVLAIVLAGCSSGSNLSKEAYSNRGQPESLVSVSSERVTFAVIDGASVDSITEWMEDDIPSVAEITCTPDSDVCASVKDMFAASGLPYTISESTDGESQVALVYHRIQARGCDSTFVDNSFNRYNLNHPAFGCATAVNQVQMVTDRMQYVQPPLSGRANAESAVAAYNAALKKDEYPF